MLIGNILEPAEASFAWQLAANKLADFVRTTWQTNRKLGLTRWEEACSEDSQALTGLEEEGFGKLVALDYIFRWWGAEDVEELAGEVVAVWKIFNGNEEKPITAYKTTIRLAERDFILGLYPTEGQKREVNRQEFQKAFAIWKDLFEAKK